MSESKLMHVAAAADAATAADAAAAAAIGYLATTYREGLLLWGVTTYRKGLQA